MTEDILQRLRRQEELEEELREPGRLSPGFYEEIARYSQSLKRSVGPGSSEVSRRLASAQRRLIESMTRSILTMRTKKASEGNALHLLLPEERDVCAAQRGHRHKLDSLVEAVSEGRPSSLARARLAETRRIAIVKLRSKVGELVAQDEMLYGPYQPEDIAALPSSTAYVLIESGDATEIDPSGL
jgi:DNA replication initiation complex subunit (GINS family)